MADLLSLLREQGFQPTGSGDGRRSTCPHCSALRRNKTEQCVRITLFQEENYAVWHCHHCNKDGRVALDTPKSNRNRPRGSDKHKSAPMEPRAIEYASTGNYAPQFCMYLAKRKITQEVVKRNRLSGDAIQINFPYILDGEVVNVKHKKYDPNAKPRYTMVKDCFKPLYGYDDVVGKKEIIICEGELDKLALEVCGFRNAASVPNGAGLTSDSEPEFMEHAKHVFDMAQKVYIATDGDEKGSKLAKELARRIGEHKCYRVTFLEKDANDELMTHGIDAVCDAIKYAEPYPVSGVYSVSDLEKSILDYYRYGAIPGTPTGWSNVNELYSVRMEEFTVVTGAPNNGKSEWIDCLLMNLARSEGMRFGIFSAENTINQHVAKLSEKLVKQPFDPKAFNRMSEVDFANAMLFIEKHYDFIVNNSYSEPTTIDWILQRAETLVYRKGINGLVIDPYNKIDHMRKNGQTETEYISVLLDKVKSFAVRHKIHVWFVAHPAKLYRDKFGSVVPPSLYDISGSSHWNNKCDVGVVVHRVGERRLNTAVCVQKVRFKEVGSTGIAILKYNREIGTFDVADGENLYHDIIYPDFLSQKKKKKKEDKDDDDSGVMKMPKKQKEMPERQQNLMYSWQDRADLA